MDDIIIIADNWFPLSNSATTRIYMLCKLFQSLGYKTDVFIINTNENKRFYLKDKNINCRWFANDNTRAINYIKKNEKVIEAVKARRKRIKFAILYQEILLPALPIYEMARELGIKVIAYFDEWYEWEKARGKRFWPVFMQNLCIRISEYVIAPKIKNKIVISRGLKKFYKRDNCFLLPTLVDLEDKIWKNSHTVDHEKIVIVYAGWPGNRDDLRMLVEVVDGLTPDEKKLINLRIFTYATTMKQLREHIPNFGQICRRNFETIEFCGEVTREKVIEELKEADFSYLLRENKWANNAGLSTKIGESLAAGTPMLVNCTSDIKYYIKDRYNGILISDMSKSAVNDSLHRVLRLSKEERLGMKKNAYKTAEKYFDYRRYRDRLKDFLDGVENE